MDLKNFEVQPDNGLFEKIERRLRMRRLARVAGGVAAVGVAVAVVWMALPTKDAVVPTMPESTAVAQVQQDAVPAEVQAVVATETADIRPSAPQQAAQVGRQESTPTVAAEPERTVAREAVVQPVAEVKTAETPQKKQVAVAQVQPVASSAVAAGEAGTEVVAASAPTSEAAPADKSKDPSSTIVHEDNLMWAPNVIVPNGDVDENRTFKLKFTSTVTEFRIIIFNRGGRQIYQSNDPAFEWDGTHDGTAMPQGAYVWVAKFRDSDGRAHQEKGTVTIIR